MEKIAIPTDGEFFSPHFGGASHFALFTLDREQHRLLVAESVEAPAHERGAFPLWLRQEGATTVLAGGMGPRAVRLLQAYGIATVIGIAGREPRAITQAYLDGTLEASGESCREQGHHDCGHHHG